MFEVLEKNFDLIDAKYLKEDIDLSNKENFDAIKNYIMYCYDIVYDILNDARILPTEKNKSLSLKQFEENYEERILYRLDDVTEEMYILQNFLDLINEKYSEQVKELNEHIDDVEAILMLIPEEIEKNKCIMLTFTK